MLCICNLEIQLKPLVSNDTLYYVRNVQPGSWQVSATPTGLILEFEYVIAEMRVFGIESQIETRVENSRGDYIYNGYVLTDQNREVRLMAEAMHQYGSIPSGPDVVTGALENLYFYTGSYIPGKAEISPVEFRLDMLHGCGVFSDLGPMAKMEIQSQDSMYQNELNPVLTQILPLYAPSFNGIYSLEKIYRYAIDRQQVSDITLFLNNANTQHAMPYLTNEISRWE